MLFIDMQKVTINTLKIMIKIKNHHILGIETYVISLGEQCLRSYLLLILIGLKKYLNLTKIL